MWSKNINKQSKIKLKKTIMLLLKNELLPGVSRDPKDHECTTQNKG